MPFYEYICGKCGKKFGETLTFKERETRKMRCPKCRSGVLQRVIEPFFAATSKKSAG